jgi:hypothetical protein
MCLFRRLLEQMKSESLSRLPANSREPGKFSNQLLDCTHRSERRRKGQLRNFPHFCLEHLSGATLRFGHCGEHQFPEELGVMIPEHCGIDRNCAHGAAAVGRDFHHPSTRGGLDRTGGELGLELLQPALHLLPQLEQLLKICHAIG